MGKRASLSEVNSVFSRGKYVIYLRRIECLLGVNRVLVIFRNTVAAELTVLYHAKNTIEQLLPKYFRIFLNERRKSSSLSASFYGHARSKKFAALFLG